MKYGNHVPVGGERIQGSFCVNPKKRGGIKKGESS